ncbi:MAG: hypothetical protein MZV70_47245 [Desulfobacterales bacterium]|nr:hypothetical protein [Desulfobacterales bacterium]
MEYRDAMTVEMGKPLLDFPACMSIFVTGIDEEHVDKWFDSEGFAKPSELIRENDVIGLNKILLWQRMAENDRTGCPH